MPKNTHATIIADSIQDGTRLTTVEVECPHHVWVHLLTHRCLSRNAQSARAIPTAKLIERATYRPERWYRAQKGMSPGSQLPYREARSLSFKWENLRAKTTAAASSLSESGCSKETVNRLLQPFSLIKGIVTGTDKAWASVFRLRLSKETQWETRELFKEIATKMLLTPPHPNPYHIPYINGLEGDEYTWGDKMMISAARCARVSYLTHDGKRDVSKDIELAHRLLKDRHASPFEHQASAIINTPQIGDWGNFSKPWYQHRKELEAEGLI